MSNMEIRNKAIEAGLKLWQVAEAYGIADCNFSRKLRRELPEAEREKVLKIIERLSKAQEGDA